MKLSIITINYNNLEGLKKTYESVVCQTWTDYEWIIIDGGSTDGSREFIEVHQDKFAYWCSEPDKGVYNAMNKGIAKAKGEYLNFMNSGDCFYEKETLEKVFSVTHDERIIYGDAIFDYGDKECLYQIPELDLCKFLYHNLPHQSMFIQRNLHLHYMYDESFKILADWDNWWKAILDGVNFVYIPIVISRYNMDGMSNTMPSICKEEYNRIKRNIPERVLTLIDELSAYRNSSSILKVHELMRKGGIASRLTKVYIRIMDTLFLSK